MSMNSGVSASPAKLAKAAEQFEAMLISNLLSTMDTSTEGTTPGNDAAQETLRSLRTQAIADALAAHGGIGLATLLRGQLHQNTNVPDDSPVLAPNGRELKEAEIVHQN
jgi:Rod binding domain-containing protein